MRGTALDQVVRKIKLRDDFVLGIVDLLGESASDHADQECRWDMLCDNLREQLSDRFSKPLRIVNACESIPSDVQRAAVSGARNSRYALLNWRQGLIGEHLILLNLRGLEPKLLEAVSLLTDGVVGVVGDSTQFAAKFISTSSNRGVQWLGYWQLQALANGEIASTMGKQMTSA